MDDNMRRSVGITANWQGIPLERTAPVHWRSASRARPAHAVQGGSTGVSAPGAIPELTAQDGSIPKTFSIDLLDRVITIFREHKPEDWRKLIAFSKMWKHMSSSVFFRFESLGL